MASTWGNSWLASWGVSWDRVVVTPSADNSGGWPMPVRRKKKKPDDEELTPAVVEAVAEAPKERRTITLQQLIGKRAAAQVDAAELSQAIRTLRLKKRQREDEELMLM